MWDYHTYHYKSSLACYLWGYPGGCWLHSALYRIDCWHWGCGLRHEAAAHTMRLLSMPWMLHFKMQILKLPCSWMPAMPSTLSTEKLPYPTSGIFALPLQPPSSSTCNGHVCHWFHLSFPRRYHPRKSLSLPIHTIATLSLISRLSKDVQQAWYAHASAYGKFTAYSVHAWWDKLVLLGPAYGYYPNASKTWLIVKEHHLPSAVHTWKQTPPLAELGCTRQQRLHSPVCEWQSSTMVWTGRKIGLNSQHITTCCICGICPLIDRQVDLPTNNKMLSQMNNKIWLSQPHGPVLT